MPIIIIAILVIIDQVVKYLTLENLQEKSITAIPYLLEFTYVENRGAAFGLFQGAIPIFIPLTIIILIGIAIYYRKLGKEFPNNLTRISLILISAGAIGNLIDRVMRAFVVDTFNFLFINFPVFNVADIYVVCGTILMLIITIFFEKDKRDEN